MDGGQAVTAPALDTPGRPAAGLLDEVRADLKAALPEGAAAQLPRRRLTQQVARSLGTVLESRGQELDLTTQRELINQLLDELLQAAESKPQAEAPPFTPEPSRQESVGRQRQRQRLETVKDQLLPDLMERMDLTVAARMSREELGPQLSELVNELLQEQKQQLNSGEQKALVALLVHDMLGLGPLEPLLADPSITDIMVNGPFQVYVERGGKLELTEVTFRNNAHVMNVATRIVTRIGRRIDESTPLVDARLEDGSRVNIIAPPLAIDGPTISIRKFSEKKITLDMMARQGNISPPLSEVLKIFGRCRLNIMISGGTGSGKTTLLNALSHLIDHGERVVTIEDAAELQLQQPHVVRLETRPPSLEGTGEITMRDLVKNALRMRPDRIILGEVRGAEAFDMLQAMNTGHDGSMCTLHANSPREALTRLENMLAMTGIRLPSKAMRTQIADSVNLIVQISRMRDGMRRITRVTEITGMEEEVITTQDLFIFEFEGEDDRGRLYGRFRSTGVRPQNMTRAEYFGLGARLMEAMSE
ncbi:CpaF family protein [Aquibaculum sediminis]|uniref:CpaF family protein n=1 Tax=Aquibaculum sediminis TaxID=3231907 RepID=UPI00345328A2